MANKEHLEQLWKGKAAWNQWRSRYLTTRPDLRGADLHRMNRRDLSNMDLHGADLSQADFRRAELIGVNLRGTNLSAANLSQTNLSEATLHQANLRQADLHDVDFFQADLSQADLHGANLETAVMIETNFEGANLTGCRVYGIAVWNINLVEAKQSDLVITRNYEPVITLDNVEVAQFIYLHLHNEKIRGVIESITSKAVLILGRFTPERKAVLDAIREEVRKQQLLPIMFDFTPSANQITLETVSTLAHIARFVIADLTDAKSVLQELQAIVPHNPSVPVQPILLASQEEPGMFDFMRRFP
jgi:uncharacterized protein YjbI with pentapeptide repeats